MADVTNLISEIEINGGSPYLFQELGKCYVKERKIALAYDAFKNAYILDELDPWTMLYIGNIHFWKKEYTKSIEWFKKSVLYLNDSAIPYLCIAKSYEKMDDHESVGFYFEQAVKVEPKNQEAIKKLEHWCRN